MGLGNNLHPLSNNQGTEVDPLPYHPLCGSSSTNSYPPLSGGAYGGNGDWW